MSVLCISVCTTTTNATIIWEEYFDDPNLPGWTIYAYENASSQVTIEGNFSAASGMLTALDDDINIARHNSTANVGTWSFDMFVPDDDFTVIYLDFMSTGAIPNIYPSMFVSIGAWFEGGRFIVTKLSPTSTYERLSDIYVDSLQGWHHIDVSRTSDGHFYVYFNGTLEDDFVNNDVTSSTYLEFFCENATGAAIDNLVVRDDITTHTTTPTTPPPPPLPLDLIVIVSGVAVVVIVLAIVLLRRR